MSDSTMNASEDSLVSSVLHDADLQAQKIIDDAKRVIEAEDAKAREEAAAIKAEILAKAQEKAAKLRAREIATARLDARRLHLKAREEAVSKVFARVTAELHDLRGVDHQYEKSLAILAVEAAKAIGETEARLNLCETDRAMAEASVRVALSNEKTSASFTFDSSDLGGGCVAYSNNGRIFFDNTYPRRIARDRNKLRLSIIREISKQP